MIRTTTSSSNNNGSSNSDKNKKKKIRGIQNGWFTETATMWPGQRFSLALKNYGDGNTKNDNDYNDKNILFHKRSEYQEILVFESEQYGKVFCIDGILQLTERDAFTFHEMMAHLPMCAHHNPEHVLIVGGGDGMVLREVCRHSQVKQITLVEIDPMVILASRECLKLVPDEIWEDPRLEIIHQDAAEYVEDPARRNTFDIILGDTLDPLGPAESLFEPDFYEAMHEALRPNGIVCTQGESMFIHFDLVRDLVACCADMFATSEYATTSVPSYPCGQVGFILARKGGSAGGGEGGTFRRRTTRTRGCSVPVRIPPFQQDLKWYNSQMHRAAFALPQYVKMELNAPDVNLHGRIGNVNNSDFNDEEDGEDPDDERCFLAGGGCTIQ